MEGCGITHALSALTFHQHRGSADHSTYHVTQTTYYNIFVPSSLLTTNYFHYIIQHVLALFHVWPRRLELSYSLRTWIKKSYIFNQLDRINLSHLTQAPAA